MYHQSTPVIVSVDNGTSFNSQLYPTTHCYGWSGTVVYDTEADPERKAFWTVGSVSLSTGQHTLVLFFPPVEIDQPLDQYTDGRPVLKSILLTNYPNFIVPGLAEPHHLDSYEHAPAMLVHDRIITELADGRLEVVYHGTFYSLSQGNELYFADPKPWPKPGSQRSRFEVVAVEPEVFHLPPEGSQDFTLTVRSLEGLPEDYSELIVLWLQGTPTSPARKPYLFTTTQHYISLPPWEYSESFWMVMGYHARGVRSDIMDPPELFLPDCNDLGFNNGRYQRKPSAFLEDQLRAGRLPSVAQIFQQNGWTYDKPYRNSWDQTWITLLASLYFREGTGQQAKDYALRLAETNVFYPDPMRWDWARPEYLPKYGYEMGGFQALGLVIKAGREGLVTEEEQFRLLHNLVLPIFNAYWGELRLVLTLDEDATAGDTRIYASRHSYGTTGSPTDGLHFGTPFIKLNGDPYRLKYVGTNLMDLERPLSKDYPKGAQVVAWPYHESIELEGMDVMSLLAVATASRDSAVIDQAMAMYSEIMEKQTILLPDGSFRNEPGSYGSMGPYMQTLRDAQQWLGRPLTSLISSTLVDRVHQAIINISQFPFSNGFIPHLNGGGCMNQLSRDFFWEIDMLPELFPDDLENIELYGRIKQQELNRVPGDIIDNHNFMVPGWGYAMLRSENGSWDRGMETLLSSKYLKSNPGDHVSSDALGIVIYGLGTILTPRYGYSWIGYAPPFLNQVMIDNGLWENDYYGSFWHFDGRKELPSAVAHTGDGDNCSTLAYDMSRWCIQFPEYLFDTTFVHSYDSNSHQYEWSHINMGDLKVVEPSTSEWQAYPAFLTDYWPVDQGAQERKITPSFHSRIVADWYISCEPWVPNGDPTLFRNEPEHSGRLRLMMADNGPVRVIDSQIGYYRQSNGEQTLANSQDILTVQKQAMSHAFVDTLEPIADDEEAYVMDITIVDCGDHHQQLIKVTTARGQDWIYLSGQWGVRPDSTDPLDEISTDADIVVWRVVDNAIKMVYIAGGSYANTPFGTWDFTTVGSHYKLYIQ